MAIASSWPGARVPDTSSPSSMLMNQQRVVGAGDSQLSSSPGSAASFTPDGKLIRRRLRSTSVLETVSPTVKRVVEVSLFVEIV